MCLKINFIELILAIQRITYYFITDYPYNMNIKKSKSNFYNYFNKDLKSVIDHHLCIQYVPPLAYVDHSGKLMYYSDSLTKVMAIPNTIAALNISKMFPKNFVDPINAALKYVQEFRVEHTVEIPKLDSNDKFNSVKLKIKPFINKNIDEELYCIEFIID